MGYPTAAKQRSQKQKGLKDECPGSVRVHDKERLAVLSTITDTGQPQSALLGMALTQQLEIIFDTVNSSRKHRNLNTAITTQRVGGWRSGNFRRCGLAERLERQAGCGWKSGGEPPHPKAH
jgi:hypothetical protein